MQVLDLRKVWEREQDKKRFVVPPEGAWIHLEWETPAPPAALWEYVTSLRLELRAQGYDVAERTDTLGGRMQPQSTYHCAHGKADFFSTVLDWKPFEYVSMRLETGGLVLVHTRRITPTESGSRLTIDVARPPEGASEEARQFVTGAYSEIGKNAVRLLEADAANGTTTLS
jgi:hypothetical protein